MALFGENAHTYFRENARACFRENAQACFREMTFPKLLHFRDPSGSPVFKTLDIIAAESQLGSQKCKTFGDVIWQNTGTRFRQNTDVHSRQMRGACFRQQGSLGFYILELLHFRAP